MIELEQYDPEWAQLAHKLKSQMPSAHQAGVMSSEGLSYHALGLSGAVLLHPESH